MIEPGQDPDDILHVTDLFTTAARLAGAMDKIPSDRITDGVDQTALFLNGEGHSRRNFIAHYSGRHLGAIRYEDFKVHIKAAHGGLPGMDFFNIRRDPGEKYGELYPGLFAVTPMQMLLRQHKDIYLTAMLAELEVFVKNDQRAEYFYGKLNALFEEIETRHQQDTWSGQPLTIKSDMP